MKTRTGTRQGKPITIKSGGKAYALAAPGINDSIAAEELLSAKLSTPERPRLVTWGEIVEGVFRLDAKCVVALVFAALRKHHAAEIDTFDKAAAVVDGAGGLFGMAESLRQISATSAASAVTRRGR